MKYECDLVCDIVSLYKDGALSEKGREAVTEHLSNCDRCRKIYDAFSEDMPCALEDDEDTVTALQYGKKVRRRNMVRTVLVVVAILVGASALSVLGQATAIMAHQRTTMVSDVEADTYNLTRGALECSAEKIDQYTLFTNSTKIVVSVTSNEPFDGTVMLWNANDESGHIMIGTVNKDKNTCVFSNLTSEYRYRISVSGLASETLRVCGNVDFGQAISMVLDDIF